MSKGKLGRAVCCPWCGTKTLVRDEFTGDTKAEHTHVSYFCTICCTGFSLRNSPRAMFVNRMYATERKQRPPEERIRHQLKLRQGTCRPLTEHPLEELERIESLLASKKPYTKSSKQHIASSLQAVRNEIARRGSTQGEVALK